MNEINLQSLSTLSNQNKLKVYISSIITAVEDDSGKPKVIFAERESETFDFIVYALGGTTPDNFLKLIGIEFYGPDPLLKGGYETSIPALFLTSNLSGGKKGGSIIWAFNSSKAAMKKICENYLEYKV